MILLILISTAIISVLTIFQCQPISYFWNRDIRGTCIDVNALAYANSGASMGQDVLIVCLPIPIVVKLQMSLQKKVGVAIMFALGGLYASPSPKLEQKEKQKERNLTAEQRNGDLRNPAARPPHLRELH